MPSNAFIQRSEARRLVDEIRVDNGGLSPEDRDATRPSVLNALANVRRKLGAATKKLATDLYSKSPRFIHELIQNAEDNSYTVAEASGDKPYLSFTLYPDRIVIESNEDGFTEKDVRAICSTGESTKTSAQGYIGEKGIGFKSVFNIAKKAHIQSEPFSFFFEHTKDSDEDGLGMVTPYNGDYNSLSVGVRTRITLTLLDPSIFKQLVHDFASIPDTLLLFLTKLKSLKTDVCYEDGRSITTTYVRSLGLFHNMEKITKTMRSDGLSTETVHEFHVTRSKLTNLPHDDSRKCTTQATTVLAFPLDENVAPVIEQQYVFAFLPIRRAGFTFLIQSDFITQANREDVVHSPRNKALLDGVAHAFRDAVLQFCEHPGLQYQWIRYLPGESVSDEFWGALRPKIISLLSEIPCLRSEGGSLYMPKKLHMVPENCRDKFGEPLFIDMPEEIYLSRKYTCEDFELLRPLGTSEITFSLLLERVRADLGKQDSRYKAITTGGDWHTRTANLLSRAFEDETYSDLSEEVKCLELIPIIGDTWESAQNLPIYLPNTFNIPIPVDLELKLVQSTAVGNIARQALFIHLGVVLANTKDIIPLIYRQYTGSNKVAMKQSIFHLQYLYWTLPGNNPVLDKCIPLVDENTQVVYRADHHNYANHIYFKEEQDKYGPYQLFRPIEEEEGLRAHGSDVHFLNPAYLEAFPSRVRRHGRSWKVWLEEIAGVQKIPSLESRYSLTLLSSEFDYLVRYRPKELVGLLKYNWSFYESRMTEDLINQIKNPFMFMDDQDNPFLPLCRSTLPLRRLKSITDDLQISNFRFLKMPEEINDENEHEWKFLERFGVRCSSDTNILGFYLDILATFSHENTDGCCPGMLQTLFRIYAAIEQHCVTQDDELQTKVFFEQQRVIYIPSDEHKEARWVTSKRCVWSAPEWLEAKERLGCMFNYVQRVRLFRSILEIGDVSWREYTDDLETMKERGNNERGKVLDIYRSLSLEFKSDTNREDFRTTFEELQLVFVPSLNIWFPLSACIWADDETRFEGDNIPIKKPYKALEHLFCEVLGVFKPGITAHVRALRKLAKGKKKAKELKNMIMLISAMDPSYKDVERLEDSKIFSLRLADGNKKFVNSYSNFAIVDRPEHRRAFAGKIKMLDFTVEEVHFCKPFFAALRMNRRYTSVRVSETTRVEDGLMAPDLSQKLQSKAYAIFRCAVHFRSPKAQDGDRSLYHLLLQTCIYVSNTIFKDISTKQNRESIEINNLKANFHLDKRADQLRLYIPMDADLQEECFFRQLPKQLLGFLSITDPEAEPILQAIVACKSLDTVDAILRDAGIIMVDGIDRGSKEDRNPAQSSSDGSEVAYTDLSSSNGRLTPSSTTSSLRSSTMEAEDF